MVSPLAIAAALEISLSADDWSGRWLVAGAFTLVAIINAGCALLFAPMLGRAHEVLLDALSRLLGVLLAAVGVELFLGGLTTLGVTATPAATDPGRPVPERAASTPPRRRRLHIGPSYPGGSDPDDNVTHGRQPADVAARSPPPLAGRSPASGVRGSLGGVPPPQSRGVAPPRGPGVAPRCKSYEAPARAFCEQGPALQ